jgi:adenylate cyclase
LLEEEGRHDEARKEIEIALRLDPESWEVNREAGRLIFREGRIADAIPFFEKASSLMDADWHNPSMLVCCFHGTGDSDELRRAAQMTLERTEKAIAKDPASAPALAAGANALAALGEDQRAKDWINRALLLDPDNILMRYNLACSLAQELKDYDRAIEVIEPYFGRTVSATQIRHADSDPDLDGIRDDPRFKHMVSGAKDRLGLPA